MNAERLLAHYERIADAPDAIVRLRRFVLDLAVRGKLVAQNAGDESASALLEQIAAERARLVKAGEIKAPKTLPPVDSPPFGLPLGWCWTPIREITSDRGQEAPRSTFTYIDVTAIDKKAGTVADPKVLNANEAPSRARKITRKGDVIYSCVRPYLLNVAVIETDFDPPAIVSTAFAVLNAHDKVVPRYIWIVLRSPFMVECVEDNQRGQAYPAINDTDFAILPFPLPPLAEQHRIVAKVDELMGLCNRLESARANCEAMRDRLAVASLVRLAAPDPETLQADARFTLDAMPTLTTRPDQIKALRQAILNFAVQGRLVPQDAEDEPASDLLKRIASEKSRLLQARTIKRDRPLPNVRKDETPFLLPHSWVWARTQDLSLKISDGVHQKPEYVVSGIPFVTVRNLTEGSGISFRETKFITEKDHAEFIKRAHPERGDVLITKDGTIGVARIIDTDIEFSIFVSVALVKMTVPEIAPFLTLCINSEVVRNTIIPKGAALKHLHLVDLRSLPLPLPPLAEQHRIVAKVGALMALCDRLEAALASADSARARLLDALLAEALDGADAPRLAAAE